MVNASANGQRGPDGPGLFSLGAKGANRTRDTALFRRVLYRLSYLGVPICERIADSPISFVNRDALVTLATLMGLEPTTFAVTGRRSNQLSYSAKTRTPTPGMVGTVGIEPTTPRV
jgi:hypothetical protein